MDEVRECAESALGATLSSSLCGLDAASKYGKTVLRDQQGRVPGIGRHDGGAERTAGDVGGVGMSENEGARFWLSVFTELRNRGMKDCFIGCRDGLDLSSPRLLVRSSRKRRCKCAWFSRSSNSLKYVSYKHRKEVATDLKTIYSASTETEAELVEPHEPVNFSHGLLRQFGQCQWRRRKLAGSPPAALELAFRNELFAFHEGKLWFAPGPRRDLVQQEFAKTPEMIGQPCGLGWGGRTPKMRCFTQFMVGKAKVVCRANQIHAFL